MFISLLLVLLSQNPTPSPVTAAQLKALTYTSADLTLYVSGTGNDSNACTASGVSACLTIQGALNKVPKHLRHKVTINIASGNYAGFTFSGFTIDPAFQKATGGFLIDGAAFNNVTPTTDTATGTASSGSIGSGTTYGTLTDSSKTWTVNDSAIVQKFVTISSGTGSGQTRVIISNTATTLTIAGPWGTAPDNTSVYAIQAPSTNITSTTALIPTPTGSASLVASAMQFFDNNFGSGTGTSSANLLIRNIGISVGGSSGLTMSGANNIFFDKMTVSAGSGTVNGNSGRVTFSNMAFNSTGIPVTMTSSKVSIGNSSFVSSASSAIVAVSSTDLTISSSYASPAGTGNSGVNVSAGSQVTVASIRCNCNSVLSSACISVSDAGSPSKASNPATVLISATSGVDVTDCYFGAQASSHGGVVWTTSTGTFSGNAITNAVRTFSGGYVELPASTTITSGVVGMSIDNGLLTGALTDLLTTYSCLTNIGTLSKVCRL